MSEEVHTIDLTSVVKDAEQHIKQWFKEHMPPEYAYHDLDHTLRVKENAIKISRGEGLSEHDTMLMALAALFHDTGYYQGGEDHEERSVDIATEWLSSAGISQDQIQTIHDLIMATKMCHEPQNLTEEIIRDADLSHIGEKGYSSRAAAMRAEKEIKGTIFTDIEWHEENLKFFDKCPFQTESARKLFGKRKQKNYAKLKAKLEALKNPESVPLDAQYDDIDKKKGVQTMYRITLRNHNHLSRIADNKASIMLSINAIMLSIIISTLAPKIDSNPHLMLPTIVAIAVCLFTIILSILSARPQITTNKFTEEKFNENKYNILFFGNFASMKLDEFQTSMKRLSQEPDKLYTSLTQDLYFLGKVLVKKYKLLNLAYTVFMIGMVLAALAFIVVFITDMPDKAQDILNVPMNNQ